MANISDLAILMVAFTLHELSNSDHILHIHGHLYLCSNYTNYNVLCLRICKLPVLHCTVLAQFKHYQEQINRNMPLSKLPHCFVYVTSYPNLVLCNQHFMVNEQVVPIGLMKNQQIHSAGLLHFHDEQHLIGYLSEVCCQQTFDGALVFIYCIQV